jgi:hypothetical protein
VKITLAGAGFAEPAHWGVQKPSAPFLGTPPGARRYVPANSHLVLARSTPSATLRVSKPDGIAPPP